MVAFAVQLSTRRRPRGLATAAGVFAVSLFLGAQKVKADLPDFTGLVADMSASVVNISARHKTSGGAPQAMPEIPFPKGSPWYEFWEKFFSEQEAPPGPEPSSQGSGFIIASDGYIATNYHVVKDADEIIVRFRDRRELAAEMVGYDELTDLALLKVDAKGLPAAKLGDSRNLMPGQWVVAIGAPFGFEYSVTAGIISATKRTLPWNSHVPFIQTDVATNPGNSGGPLLNMRGEVIGINSQIYSRTGTFAGLAFVIPIEFAMNTLEQMKDGGRVSHGWLGVYVQEVTYELSRSFGMERPKGALISNVLDDSPADKAGLQVGDVVLRFGDDEVGSSASLPYMVGMVVAGADKEVELLRDGKRLTLEVTLGEMPDRFLQGRGETRRSGDEALGMHLRALTADEVQERELEQAGLLVEKVLEDSVAGRGGVVAGDVVLMFSGRQFESAKALKEFASELPAGQFVTVLVHRKGRQLFLALHLSGDE